MNLLELWCWTYQVPELWVLAFASSSAYGHTIASQINVHDRIYHCCFKLQMINYKQNTNNTLFIPFYSFMVLPLKFALHLHYTLFGEAWEKELMKTSLKGRVLVVSPCYGQWHSVSCYKWKEWHFQVWIRNANKWSLVKKWFITKMGTNTISECLVSTLDFASHLLTTHMQEGWDVILKMLY